MSLPLLILSVLPTIWIVDASNGPGTNFTNLPPAVAAAASGDTIIVKPGTYSAFSVSGKSLTIRGAGSATTTVQSGNTSIGAVPAGSPFYVSGLRFVAASNAGLFIGGLTTEAVLTDIIASGVGCCASLFGTEGLHISGGAIVHAARSTFMGTPGYSAQGGSGAIVDGGSTLAADACGFSGGGAGGGFLPVSGSGVYVYNGFATLSRCSASGGPASFGFGGQGIAVLQGGFARVAGTAANVVSGGAGANAPGGYAIYADATSSAAIVHGPVALQSAAPGGALTTGAVTLGAPPLPYLSVTGSATAAGELLAAQPVTFTFNGAIPSAPYSVIVDFVPTFSTAFAAVALGELLVPVPFVIPLEGTLNASGTDQFTITPAAVIPAFLDVPLYLQFGVLDAVAGKVRLSNGYIRIFKS
jgi:hypothetical protein